MKKIYFVFLFLLVFLPFVSAEQSVITGDNLFRITLLGHDPSPLQPGQEASLRFEISYLGTERLPPLDISLSSSFPLSLASGEVLEHSLGSFDTGQIKSFTYKVFTNSGAESGTYKVGLQYYSPVRQSQNTVQFTLDVLTPATDLSGASVSTFANQVEVNGIAPGSSSEVRVRIENLGLYTMRDVSIKLDLSAENIPFSPIGGTSERKISSIPIGSSSEASISVIALPDSKGGVYKIPLMISYYDAFGTLIEKSDLVGLIISAPADVGIIVDDTTIYSTGPGTVSLKFVNKGLTGVKFLSVRLENSRGYKVLGASEEYIGDLDSDDYEIADFLIHARKKSFDLHVVAEYKDTRNVAHVEEFSVPFQVSSKKALGLNDGSSFLQILIFVLIIIYLVIDFRRWRKGREDLNFEQYFPYLWKRIVQWIARFPRFLPRRRRR